MKKKSRVKNTTSVLNKDKLKELASLLKRDPAKALEQTQRLLSSHPQHVLLLILASDAARLCKQKEMAISYAEQALVREPDSLSGLLARALVETENQNYTNALPFLERAEANHPDDENVIGLLALCLIALKKYDELSRRSERIEKFCFQTASGLQNYANALLDTGRLADALAAFERSIAMEPDNPVPYINKIVALHYSPNHTAEDILKECKGFQKRFSPKGKILRAHVSDLSPDKTLRIGMISDGFRRHPVGSMITLALAHIPKEEIEFFAYATNTHQDDITRKIKNICTKWEDVKDLSPEELDRLIRSDKVDILIDLSGFNTNSRVRAVMMEPAPIIVKWVGGLISSTGLDAMDYLISDKVETPLGADELYTEKLIRLPNDYICFDAPSYTPPLNDLPAERNGYVTFGCFNNAAKINDILLERWAGILNAVPKSQLFLKSHGYSSKEFCERIHDFFARLGIEKNRIRLEGPAPHRELLDCYNDVDIALDPWPYSGGLTTCEALLMGVPVITLPGPTFAGRHSATHLVNAGLPELVAEDWDGYHQLATSLAGDLDALATIRQNLRLILLQSPLCDAERFGRAFSNAMRAIWQRHCSGKAPEALVLSDDLTPYFADESGPVELLLPKRASSRITVAPKMMAEAPEAEDEFRFSFAGRIVVVDNGTNLAATSQFSGLEATNAFQFILLDPGGVVDKGAMSLEADPLTQLLPFHVLGDGEKVPLYATLDPLYSSTLEPIECNGDSDEEGGLKPTSVIAKASAFTVQVESIAGHAQIDWLLLSGRHAVIPIIAGHNAAIRSALVVHISYPVQHRYKDQSSIDVLTRHMNGMGFDLYRVDGMEYHDYMSCAGKVSNGSASGGAELPLLFVPAKDRFNSLTENEKERLAFILHTFYQAKDLVYNILSIVDASRAQDYLRKTAISGESAYQEKGTLPQYSGSTLNKTQDIRNDEKDNDDIVSTVSVARELSSKTANELGQIIQSCEENLASDQRDNRSFFLLTKALMALQGKAPGRATDLPSSFWERLFSSGWDYKGSLYGYWLSEVRIINTVVAPVISVVIIANKFKPEIVENMRALRCEGGRLLQMLFVNNGCSDEEFTQIKPFVDVWIRTKSNSGAYLARNLGALYSDAPILLFVDDDGIPQPNFIAAHLDAHSKYELASLRGRYHQRDRSTEPAHYDLGSQMTSAIPLLEGNASFSREHFMRVGGWGDYILFGHGGIELTYRLIKKGFTPGQFGYTPSSILLHEYLRGANHAKQKSKSQSDSWKLLESLHDDIRQVLGVFNKSHALKTRGVVSKKKTMAAPAVTFPNEVASYVEKIYKSSETILEYGSGGSTILAAGFPNKKIISVENDQEWAENMKEYIGSSSLPSRPIIYPVNVGETGKWAKPKNSSRWEDFHKYPLKIWGEDFFDHPDVILIDGRFRVACFVTAYLKVVKPTIVLFDDYVHRRYYHIVERLVKPTEIIGRMARFDLKRVEDIPREHLEWMVQYYNKVTYADS